MHLMWHTFNNTG